MRTSSLSLVPALRLVVLMVEVEQPEGISARKLILETARHNVITAYNGDAAVELLKRFPNVDLAVLHTELEGQQFESTARRLKEHRPGLYIVAITPTPHSNLDGVNKVLGSHQPQELLDFLANDFHAAASAED
jgi:CheY-like chemotaxis protein